MIPGILRLEGKNMASGTSTNLQNVRVAMLQVVCEEKRRVLYSIVSAFFWKKKINQMRTIRWSLNSREENNFPASGFSSSAQKQCS